MVGIRQGSLKANGSLLAFGKGSAISLALLAALYGVAFGAGVAGPIGHFLRDLLDERLGALERCEKSVAELIARSSAAAGG